MRKLITIMVVFLILVVAFYSLKGFLPKEQYVVKINQFKMTDEEFEDYFAKMNASRDDNFDSRSGVLDALVSKKLILQEAEKIGLQKSEEFLDALQHYYEQLLFKLIVDLKSKELSSLAQVTDAEVKERYDKMQAETLTDKPLDDVYSQIKWQVLREKQTQALNDWLKDVKEDSEIDINYDAVLNK